MIEPTTPDDAATARDVSDEDLSAASGGASNGPTPLESDGPSVRAVIF